MLAKRIIPCLDVKDGRTVKGINFSNLTDAGDPVELAKRYYNESADELVLLDISATLEGRETFVDTIINVAKAIAIPFTVGGGISSVQQAERLLKAGADKVSINTAAIQNPRLIGELAERFGSQCVVVAIDTKLTAKGWEVVTHAGTQQTGIMADKWAKTCEMLGAGEILLTSFTSDGTQQGFAIDITREISQTVNIPVIASGGAGMLDHFAEVFIKGKADAALAAGIFHYGMLTVKQVKEYLLKQNINVRN
ncbi:imidazole glycerol phosphate synthase subunit HisF [Tenuifilum thalassicum]|uniref:Imidazole glycerol phosphate synthase subunit HisF n=1 Tax=Tenuifilum thalassicum TaxID=2590900 RepID=A0A7D3XKW1_9BACT|nr:imidazole glycerol phosphate synthase subunit HisF [Tenuifilum thalassicum]QKG80050.1 imidazole glycerol phosphate synthase subunit HisF [Tenuifilum thalassicum]